MGFTINFGYKTGLFFVCHYNYALRIVLDYLGVSAYTHDQQQLILWWATVSVNNGLGDMVSIA